MLAAHSRDYIRSLAYEDKIREQGVFPMRDALPATYISLQRQL
jgi:hypothetical protein